MTLRYFKQKLINKNIDHDIFFVGDTNDLDNFSLVVRIEDNTYRLECLCFDNEDEGNSIVKHKKGVTDIV